MLCGSYARRYHANGRDMSVVGYANSIIGMQCHETLQGSNGYLDDICDFSIINSEAERH